MNDRQLSVKNLIGSDAMKARFAEVLKAKAPGFLASVSSQAASGPLANVDPMSVMAAALVAATLDLPIDRNLGFAWIVPYKGQAQFQMGYRGYVQLAQRSGRYRRMNAFAVNEEAVGGYDEVGEPIINFEKLDDNKPAVGYAFIFKLDNGFTKCVYWTKAKVERHGKRYSQSFGSGTSPWKSNFDEMALKTVTANALKKWGPLSVEMIKGMTHDQGVQIDVDTDVVYPDNGGTVPQIDTPPAIGRITDTPPTEQQAETNSSDQEQEATKDNPASDGPTADELIKQIMAKAGKLNAGKTVLAARLIELKLLDEGKTVADLDAKQATNVLDAWDEQVAPTFKK